MLLSIRHVTRYGYVPEASRTALRIKLFPAVTSAQQVRDWSVTVNEQQVTPLHVDALGDGIALWHSHVPIGTIDLVAAGTIETFDSSGVIDGLKQRSPKGLFLRQTPLTKPDAGIEEMVSRLAEVDRLAWLHALCAEVHDCMQYRPGATTAQTTAAEALALGTGVCQDLAHIFIAASRGAGVPARYVVGYLHDPEVDQADQASSTKRRAEETHAWAEAHVPGLGWVGFDPVHKRCPTDAYARLTSGLDADDAAPVRGNVVGLPEETLNVEISVSAAQHQSQQ